MNKNEFFEKKLSDEAEKIEAFLQTLCPKTGKPELMYESMYYSLFSKGKRIRAILLVESAALSGGSERDALVLAASIEMIHAYSLVHDDLPCMDDAQLRRGLPSNHIKFGYPQALLAGDGLLNLAYETLIGGYFTSLDKEAYMKAAEKIAVAAGVGGMVSGQCADVSAQNLFDSTEEEIRFINLHKTGALLEASILAGALLGNLKVAEMKQLADYAAAIGEMFQLVDDLIDVYSDAALAGKMSGNDDKNGKLTYPHYYGVEKTKARIDELYEKCLMCTGAFGQRAEFFSDMAYYLKTRKR